MQPRSDENPYEDLVINDELVEMALQRDGKKVAHRLLLEAVMREASLGT